MKRVFKFRTMMAIAASLLLANGTFAQILTAYDDVAETSYYTVGSSFRLYALPDVIYSPGYVASANAPIGATARWTWTYLTLTGAPLTGVASPLNYVEFTAVPIGAYTITVVESNTLGGCIDGTPESQDVAVVAAPTGTMTINPGAAWSAITPNVSYQICDAQLAQTVTVAFVENIPNTIGSYAFQIMETIDLIDGAGTVLRTEQAATVIQDFPLNNKVKGSNVGTLTGAAFTSVTPNFTFTFSSDALAILQNAGLDARTRYTYTVTRTGDDTNNDFLSNISHKSDYLLGAGNENYYTFGNNTVSFIVNPAPTTGPIYHIPNDFAY